MIIGKAAGFIKTGIENKQTRNIANSVARKIGQPSIRGGLNMGRNMSLGQVQRRGYRRMALGGGALAANGMISRMNNRMGYGSSGTSGVQPRSSGGYA